MNEQDQQRLNHLIGQADVYQLRGALREVLGIRLREPQCREMIGLLHEAVEHRPLARSRASLTASSRHA